MAKRMVNRVSLLAVVAFCILSTVSGGFTNPYPRYEHYDDGGDPGEPLFLTDLIHAGELDKARTLATVDHPQMNSAPSYSGYLTVNKQLGSNLFFWYFPAKLEPTTAPVVLWLQGGPGASSLFGLFTENGPFSVTKNGKLQPRKYSWHINHHLIYIDNPVGTGFSFATNESGYAKTESDVGNNLYEAMSQFFRLFPDLHQREFYITGESYAGKYVPALAHTIHVRNKHAKPDETPINLAGLAIGNGLSDPLHQMNYADYLYQLGLIDTNGQFAFAALQKEGIDCIHKEDYICAFEKFDKLINMDEDPNGSLFKNLTGLETYYNYVHPDIDVNDQAMGAFLQASDTRRAIHVGNNSFHDLAGENKVEEHLKEDVMKSVAPWVSDLLSHYRVLIYNGQLDIIVAYPLTVNYLKHLKFEGDIAYKTAERYVWKVDNEVAGYVKHAGNLTEVMVRDAGHMVPGDQPKWALDMLLRMTTKKGFPMRV